MGGFIRFRTLSVLALFLALAVVQLGAYVRLSDAGLGCPDWPGCYGQAVVPQTTELFTDRPLDHGKAWKEMIHRYGAGALGILILALFSLSRIRKGLAWARPLTATLLLLTGFQALLGMWTVTLRLLPVVVMGHLLGGLAITALLLSLALGPISPPTRLPLALVRWCRFALAVVVVQVVLGGWTSANYAAPVCPDFPRCQGQWWPQMDFSGAMLPVPPPERGDYEGGTLDGQARTAIHVTHRVGAVVTFFVVGGLALRLLKTGAAASAAVMGIVVVLQFALGVANIWSQFPLALAVAHNGGAALLFLATVALNIGVRPEPAFAQAEFADG